MVTTTGPKISPDGPNTTSPPTIETNATDQSPPLFADYVGIGFDASRLEMFYLYPSEETWGRGDRQIACIVTAPAGGELTGSVAGTAR